MKTIYIYSPSGAVRDRAGFRRAVRRLQLMGYEVAIDPAALASHQRFAGDDAARLQAITRAAESGADATLITRGGYGITRFLGHPDLAPTLKTVAQSIDAGCIWLGLSDFTVLQSMLYPLTKLPTWGGATLIADFGMPTEPDEITLAALAELLGQQTAGCGWRLNAADAFLAQSYADKSLEGRLWGGNLAVLSSLIGTPWMPKIKGGILFLEDVGEHPYKIERMLTQWLHSGILAKQQAILLGSFTGYKTARQHDRGFSLKTVAAWLAEKIPIPIFSGLPFGHVPSKILLPFGAKTKLSFAGREAFLMFDLPNYHNHDDHNNHHDHH